MSALSDICGSASGDPRLEFFRCQYLVEIIDRLTFGEVYWLEKRIELAQERADAAFVEACSGDYTPSGDLCFRFDALWHAVYQHRRERNRYATARL